MSIALERLLIKTKNNEFYVGYKLGNHFEIPLTASGENKDTVLFLLPEDVERFYLIDELLAGVEG